MTPRGVQVSKLDTCDFSAERFAGIQAAMDPFLRTCGFKEGSVRWLPAVGPSGENLVKSPEVSEGRNQPAVTRPACKNASINIHTINICYRFPNESVTRAPGESTICVHRYGVAM